MCYVPCMYVCIYRCLPICVSVTCLFPSCFDAFILFKYTQTYSVYDLVQYMQTYYAYTVSVCHHCLTGSMMIFDLCLDVKGRVNAWVVCHSCLNPWEVPLDIVGHPGDGNISVSRENV